MPTAPKKDNATILLKVNLRRAALRALPVRPVVMETNGGFGEIWKACYSDVESGVVIEKDPEKCEALAKQRPGWAVYRADSVAAVAKGAGAHLQVNFVDVDPWGDPNPLLEGFFTSSRAFPPILAMVVTDGLRQYLCGKSGWESKSLQKTGAVDHFGNDHLHRRYAEVCRFQMEKLAGLRGYRISNWTCYHCGWAQQMTHYSAVFVRSQQMTE
jgi:hypothetical protein